MSHQCSGKSEKTIIIFHFLGAEKFVELLLRKGAEVNSKTPELGQTALDMAVLRGHEKVVKYLVENGADVNVVRRATFSDGILIYIEDTPLHTAVKKGSSHVIVYVL